MTAPQKKAFVERMRRAREGRVTKTTTTTALAVVPKRQVQYLAPPPRHSPPKSTSMARRVSSAAIVAAVQEKQLIATAITGAAIGYVEAEGWLKELPEVESLPIGKTGSLAIASYALNRFVVKDPETKKILTGITSAAVAISSYQMGKGYALKAQAEKALKGIDGEDLDDDGAGV